MLLQLGALHIIGIGVPIERSHTRLPYIIEPLFSLPEVQTGHRSAFGQPEAELQEEERVSCCCRRMLGQRVLTYTGTSLASLKARSESSLQAKATWIFPGRHPA